MVQEENVMIQSEIVKVVACIVKCQRGIVIRILVENAGLPAAIMILIYNTAQKVHTDAG